MSRKSRNRRGPSQARRLERPFDERGPSPSWSLEPTPPPAPTSHQPVQEVPPEDRPPLTPAEVAKRRRALDDMAQR